MDIRRRPVASNPIQGFDSDRAIAFSKGPWPTLEALKQELIQGIGYPNTMVEKWLQEGRIRKVDEEKGCYYSEVNPAFRALCYERIFDTDCGHQSWETIAKEGLISKIRVLVADDTMTVCDESCLREMEEAILAEAPKTSNHPSIDYKTLRFSGATHSIHNSRPEAFLEALALVLGVHERSS